MEAGLTCFERQTGKRDLTVQFISSGFALLMRSHLEEVRSHLPPSYWDKKFSI